MSTLLCCALPVLFVTLGMGASFAALTSAVPQVIWIAEHKGIVFIVTAILLLVSFLIMRKNEQCEIDAPEACQDGKNLSKIMCWVSFGAYIVGLSFAYIIPRILYGAP